MGRWANADGTRRKALEEGACMSTCADGSDGKLAGDDRAVDRAGQPNSGWPNWSFRVEGPFGGNQDRHRPPAGREFDRLRQLRRLSISLAQSCTVDDIVDMLSVRVAADCGAETSVVYLMDPDQEDVLRLAAARGTSGLRLRSGGAVPGWGRADRPSRPGAAAAAQRRPRAQRGSDHGGGLPPAAAEPTRWARSPTGFRATSRWMARTTNSCWWPAAWWPWPWIAPRPPSARARPSRRRST